MAGQADVWDVYDALRTARLNQYYFTERLQQVGKKNRVVEIVLAIVAPGSAVAGFALWNSDAGKVAWAAIAFVAGVVAVAKPILGYAAKVEQYQKLATTYRAIANELEDLVSAIRGSASYTAAETSRFSGIEERRRALASDEPLEPVDEALRSRFTQVVNREYPVDSFPAPKAA
jgi:hypothetical protein